MSSDPRSEPQVARPADRDPAPPRWRCTRTAGTWCFSTPRTPRVGRGEPNGPAGRRDLTGSLLPFRFGPSPRLACRCGAESLSPSPRTSGVFSLDEDDEGEVSFGESSDAEREMTPDIPKAPSVKTFDDSGDFEGASDVDSRTLRAFVVAVIYANAAVLLVALGPMLWFFEGWSRIGPVLFVLGSSRAFGPTRRTGRGSGRGTRRSRIPKATGTTRATPTTRPRKRNARATAVSDPCRRFVMRPARRTSS